jgi:hypothetical protein
MFVVRARREAGGRWVGIVERARTGEKRRFEGVDEIGSIIADLLDQELTDRRQPE